MNLRLVSKQLGIISILIGATMLFSLPWAHQAWGTRTHDMADASASFEWSAFWALSSTVVICFSLGAWLMWWGRRNEGQLFRKEAMAVVGLSWILATILGALPFYFSGTFRGAGVRLTRESHVPLVYDFGIFDEWIVKDALSVDQYDVVWALLESGAKGATLTQLQAKVRERREALKREISGEADPVEQERAIDIRGAFEELAADNEWRRVLSFPGESGENEGEAIYRIQWIRMSFIDCLFESQSGFSTTGATVISDVETPELVPHAILFWRSSTHFLGGLGIIVLFVAILGQGSAGKALMRAEMPGPSKEGSLTRMQHTAWLFAAIYIGLNLVLVLLLRLFNLTWFDALCHAFGTMATGGFSTYNTSVGHFDNAAMEYTIVVFMVLAGTNFTLLYLVLVRRPEALFRDVEWRIYALIIIGVTILVMGFGLMHGDFITQIDGVPVTDESLLRQTGNALRYGLFQVVAILTTTGYGTHDFDGWNSFGRGALFLLMFVGGCAGSTGGGLKVIRHVLFLKILRLEIEQSFHPSVVRPLRLAGKPVDDPDLRNNILVYFGLILVIFVFSWMLLVTTEPDTTWGGTQEHKLIDSASGVAATLNNIGPGLGTVGATQNYGHFSQSAKVLFTWLMMIGRLEIFVILVLFVPGFWRNG